MTDQIRSEEKLNEDQYLLDERKFYLDLLRTNSDTSRKEVKDRILQANTTFNKNLTEDKNVSQATWEEIIETMGYKIERNRLYQEIKDYTTYHCSRTIPPMQACLCKVFLLKDHKKNYNIKSMDREVKLLLGLNSDRIFKLLGAIEVTKTEKMYFFEELSKMSLTSYFKAKPQHLTLLKAKTWLCEIASGILYLHNQGFAHQKINLDCIYIKDGESLKLGCPDALAEQVSYDLIKAVSKFADLARPLKKNQFSSFDLLFGDKTYDAMSADVWSLGVLLYYFLTLKFPFNNWKVKKDMNTEIQCKRWSFIGMMDDNPKLDQTTITFLSKIFLTAPAERLTIHEVIVDYYLFKRADLTPPPPPPPPPPVIPPVRTETEQEYDWVCGERQNQIQQLKAFQNQYTEKYRFKRFQPFLSQVNNHQLTTKEFDKANYEEGVQKEVKILRTNLIYEANETQLYEAQIREENCLVKVELLNDFQKKNQVKNLQLHVKMLLELKHPEKFIQLIKCYTIENKIYFFLSVDKSVPRLSEKFLEESPISLQLARTWTRQLIDALHLLHGKGIALRCLDPEYIFIKNNNLIIGQTENAYCVFSFDDTQGSKVTFPTKNSIKTLYSSPEAIHVDNNGTYDPFAADIWSMAAIMYHLLFLRSPFEVKNKKVYYEQIEQKRWLHLFDKKYKLDNDFFSFFDLIFVENADSRPIAIELMFSNVYTSNHNQ